MKLTRCVGKRSFTLKDLSTLKVCPLIIEQIAKKSAKKG